MRENQAALNARDQALTELRHAYSHVADSYAADAALVGMQKVADKVRPTAKRRDGTPEPADTADPGAADFPSPNPPDGGASS